MTPHATKSVTLKGNEATINIGSMKKPGFLRVKASVEKDGKNYSTISTVGFDTEKLQPTVTQPTDFKSFWDAQLEAVRKTDLQPTMTLIPERCTDKVNVYHISYRNINNTRMYGILTMPKADGKYPAILRFPGAGVGEKSGDIGHAAKRQKPRQLKTSSSRWLTSIGIATHRSQRCSLTSSGCRY